MTNPLRMRNEEEWFLIGKDAILIAGRQIRQGERVVVVIFGDGGYEGGKQPNGKAIFNRTKGQHLTERKSNI